jgi:hypothetical protein
MKKKLLYAVALIVVGLGGCKKDFLETKPYDADDAAAAFSTPEKVAAAMNGLYDIMTRSGFTNHVLLTTEVKGRDMFVVSTGNYGRFVNEYRFLQSPTVGYGFQFWRDGFALLNNSNRAIVNLPDAPISAALKTQNIAEARAIRAWTYHQLIRLFAQPYTVDSNSVGLPKIEVPLSPNDVVPQRAAVKEIYAFMLSDLQYAKANLTRTGDVYKFTKEAIDGMLARVYLDMGNWSKAAEHAKLARARNPLAAASTLLDGFVDPTSEWIFGLDYRSDDNTGYLQLASFLEPYDIGYSTFRATPSYYALFADNDIRKKQFYVNLDLVNYNPGDALQRDTPLIRKNGYLMNKFYFRDAWDLDMPLMRSAEMYLIEAEAEAEMNHDDLAQAALFEVQKRAITGAVKSTNTGAALKNEISVERRKELQGEGFAFFDIIRRKETLTRVSPEHWSPITLAPGDYRNILPIPQQEREASGMQQNAGYPL